MFDIYNVRYKICLVWLLSFTLIWIIFQNTFPLNSMSTQLDKIEESIQNGNWDDAEKYTLQFKKTFITNRMFIQMNNATEALVNFEHTIGQLEMTVKYRQDSALEFVGALKESLNLVIKPFSGP